MKKYITLFSLIALFFIGMQHTQAQTKEQRVERAEIEKRRLNPEYDAKMKRVEKEEAIEIAEKQMKEFHDIIFLTIDQQQKTQDYYLESNEDIKRLEKKIDSIKTSTTFKIESIMTKNQKLKYRGYLEKYSMRI